MKHFSACCLDLNMFHEFSVWPKHATIQYIAIYVTGFVMCSKSKNNK